VIWLTWRQSRATAAALLGFLAVVAVTLALTASHLRHDFATSGLAGCAGDDCGRAQHRFAAAIEGYAPATLVFYVAIVALYALPALIGMFLGAPLIARELEARTLRLTWSQAVTRRRWLAVKLSLPASAAAIVAGVISLAVTWWSRPIDQAAALPAHDQGLDLPNQFDPLVFGARGLVPVGYALLAFALGAVAGAVLRRTLAAMAVTIAVLAALQMIVPVMLRASYATPARTTVTMSLHPGMPQNIQLDRGRMTVTTPVDLPGAWVLDVRTVDRGGADRPVQAPPACASAAATIADCDAAINQLGLQQQVTYQPSTRFWRFQLTETALYLVMTGLLIAFGWHRGKRVDLT
jgi:ABC-type transport system involved in multi-copper enzyme maturation permease subunit